MEKVKKFIPVVMLLMSVFFIFGQDSEVEAADNWTLFYTADSGNRYYYGNISHARALIWFEVKKVDSNGATTNYYGFIEKMQSHPYQLHYGTLPGNANDSTIESGTIPNSCSDMMYYLWEKVIKYSY